MAIRNNIEDWFLRKKANMQEMRRAKRRKNLQEHALSDNRVLLSPTIISPENTEKTNRYRYNLVKELRNAIDSNNCYNIAITGVYGSGKSSIIQTYLAEMPSYYKVSKVLTLSLSNFMDEAPEGKELVAYEKTIESKLFQHILFKANEDRTAQSHYKKISNISVKRAFVTTVFFVFAILSFFVVFYPQHILSIKYVNDVYNWMINLVREYEIYPLMTGYDRYSSQYLVKSLEADGYRMDDVYQGDNLWGTLQNLEGLLKDKKINIGDNDLLKSHLLNSAVKMSTERGRGKLVKIIQRSLGGVDV